MKILALEFSTSRRSVAVLDDATLLAERSETEGQDLPPLRLVEEALQAARMAKEQIDLVAVGLGPGSYTGIRGAIALAQGWQLAVNVRLTGLSSVDCIAAQAQEEGVFGNVNVVVDAQRGEFYTKAFEISKKFIKQASELKIVTLTQLKSEPDKDTLFVGPEITRWFPEGRVVFATAAVLGKLAARENRFIPGHQLEPIYLRETTFVKAAPPRVLPGSG